MAAPTRPGPLLALVATVVLLGCGQPASVTAPPTELPLPVLPASAVESSADDRASADPDTQPATPESADPESANPRGAPTRDPGRPDGVGLAVPPDARVAPDAHVGRGHGATSSDVPVSGAGPDDAPAPDVRAAAPSTVARLLAGSRESDWRQLRGFVGTRWTARTGNGVRVLPDTVVVDGGVVTGLVRNETDRPVGPVVVAVDDRTTTVLVAVVRPGEPAPFRLETGEAGASTGRSPLVQVSSAPVASSPSRDVRLVTWWRRGGPGEAVPATHLGAPGPGATHVAFGSASAFDDVEGLGIVGAHLDDDGRVLAVAEAVVEHGDLAAGAAGDWMLTVPSMPGLETSDLMLWGSGS